MEFVLWTKYLNDDLNAFHREDYYLAAITAEVRRGHAKRPEKVKVSDCILKFTDGEVQEKEDRMAASKRFWLAGLGIKVED